MAKLTFTKSEVDAALAHIAARATVTVPVHVPGSGKVQVKVSGVKDLSYEAAILTGKFDSFECVLKSGRKFRYQLAEYPFWSDTTPSQAEALARRIVAEKFRFCEWDRAHPQSNSEEEIIDEIKTIIMYWAAEIGRIEKSC